MKKFKVSITPENDIPAFAGYLSGSVRDPEIKIAVNIEAMVNTAVDGDNIYTFEELFSTSVTHEMLHAFQDLYKKSFDEDEVERVLEEAYKLHHSIPKSLEPVVAKIEHVNSLGTSTWYEVVYFNEDEDQWKSYGNSTTFKDGEQVLSWTYADSCF